MGIGIVSPTFALKIKSIVLFVNELNFSFMVYHIRSQCRLMMINLGLPEKFDKTYQ